jgi:hypothetical protein
MFLPKKKILYFSIIILVIFTSVFSASAEDMVYFSQEDTLVSDHRLTLKDFTISGDSDKPEPGDSILLSYYLEYSAEMPNPLTVTLPNGLYFMATSPDGEEIAVGGSYINEVIEPGSEFRVRAPFTPEKSGLWKFSPAYYVRDKRGVGLTSPDDWQVAEIMVNAPSYLPDISIAGAEVSYNEKFPSFVTLYYTVENTGGAVIPSAMLMLEVGGQNVTDGIEISLNPGESVQSTYNIPVEMVGEGSLIKITGDCRGILAESNEDNNVLTLDYSGFASGNSYGGEYPVLTPSAVTSPGTQSGGNSSGISDTADNSKTSDTSAVDNPSGDVNAASGIIPDYSSCNIQFIVLGILAVIMSAVSFILGYLFSECGKGRREVEWLTAKVDRLKSENCDLEHYNKNAAAQPVKEKDSKENRMKKAIDDLKKSKDL